MTLFLSRMSRCTFLASAGGLLAAPLAAEAQHPAGKIYRVGMLETRSAA
jgi:hypothetical protein